jgi:hypothetical protein
MFLTLSFAAFAQNKVDTLETTIGNARSSWKKTTFTHRAGHGANEMPRAKVSLQRISSLVRRRTSLANEARNYDIKKNIRKKERKLLFVSAGEQKRP